MKTGLTAFTSGVLGLGKHDKSDATWLEGFHVLEVEGVSTIGADDMVADQSQDICALVGCGVMS